MHFQIFIFLLDNLTRVDLKIYDYNTSRNASIKVVQSPLTIIACV